MDQQTQRVAYRFVIKYDTTFGEALYLSGNIRQLGSWDPQRAIKMNFQRQSVWTVQIIIPLGVDIEFKYFVAPFNILQSLKPRIWLGNENSRLRIDGHIAQNFRQRGNKQLKIMSFNVRFENEKDKHELSWASRKDNCAQVIINDFPDIIGVQEPKKPQREYLMSKFGSYYDYYGKPRNLQEDEQSGIFIRKDKFQVLEDGYIWINEKKIEGKKGFGARLPRYFTYLLVSPFSDSAQIMLVFNTHLDHQTPSSKLHGIKFMTETIQSLNKKYNNQIKDIFVTGDFNTSDDDQIFQHLAYNGELLRSMRQVLPQNVSDHRATFNGFSKMLKYIDKTMKFFNLDPGATIDHIFFRSQSFKPVSFKCIMNEEKIISDHFPIMGIFECTK